MTHRGFVWAAVVTACLQVSPASAQQVSSSGGRAPAAKALTMLGAAVPVSNLDRAIDFYTKGLGMQTTTRMDTRDVIEAPLTFPGGGPYVVLLWPKTQSAMPYSPPATQRIILDVPDLEALDSQLKANGYQLKGPISGNPQHHVAVAQVDDPDGNHLELVQRSP